jgi:hexosaminidase
MNVRYIRVLAKNRGSCPDWHPGAGNPAWLFIDEVVVE